MGVEVVYHIRRRWDLNVGLQRQMEMSLPKLENLVQETLVLGDWFRNKNEVLNENKKGRQGMLTSRSIV